MSHRTSIWAKYKLRLRRKRLLLRAARKRCEIVAVRKRTDVIGDGGILLFATMRNEMQRLPYFMAHYRRLGVNHFLIVDNGSEDGSDQYLAAQPDVSVWHARAGYKASRFGLDWLTCLQWRYGHGHWCVTVDADELLIYPEWDRRDLHDLTQDLQAQGLVAMGALMLDLYPKGPVGDQIYAPGQDPTETLGWFDAYGYWAQVQHKMGNLWLQGGPRARYFFADNPDRAPTLNKIPLVRWDRSFVYVNSTHNALPASLNQTYDTPGHEKPSGVLLHTKFLPDAPTRARTELQRGQHFANPEQYREYYVGVAENPDLWCEESVKYEGWQQLTRLHLMSRGGGDAL